MVNRNAEPEFKSFATRSHSPITSAIVMATLLMAGLLLISPGAFAQPAQGSPRWVMQTRVQEALGGDPRFKDVHVTVTQPGTVILEGNVFDRKSFDAAAQIASGVQ